MQTPSRPRSTWLALLLLWFAVYASVTLFTPPLLDDADSVHAEVAREMLLRHDYVTLYANGIRYLEKAPLLYWSMAASMKMVMLLGFTSARALAAAARLPVALDVLGLAWLAELLARRLFGSPRAGLYAVLITLSSFGIFLFTRTTIPDAGVCLWLTLAIAALWQTETQETPSRPACVTFAIACALNVLTKGLIGLVFPVAIVVLYLLMTRGVRRGWQRVRQFHPLLSVVVFLVVAAPWHVLAGMENPTQGHPAAIFFDGHHWHIPLPTDGNVRGWYWFYFVNEHLLRYLNLRVPRDYDTAPLWLFWGLCLVWMMPWSAFVFKAVAWAAPLRDTTWRSQWRRHDFPLERRAMLLLLVWAGFTLAFFSLSTRQEYYVLPALPAVAILIAGWLAHTDRGEATAETSARLRCTAVLLSLGAVFAAACCFFLLHTRAPAANTDLASLLAQNPQDYALSMGHFLDLNAQSIGLFRVPLALAALGLFLGPLASWMLQRKGQLVTANLALAAGAFSFLAAALLGLRTFSPVLTSAQLASVIAPQVRPQDLIVIHGEYEAGSTLGFYLQRSDVHILEGRSSNLWYGSFFPDAPPIFETPESLHAKWQGPQRMFLWQSRTDPPNQLPPLSGPVYVLVNSGGKEIVSNQPNR